MKNLTLKAFLLITCFFTTGIAYSQTNQFIDNLYKTDSVGADAIVKEIVTLSGKGFKFNSRNIKNDLVVYVYDNPNNDKENLVITVSSWKDGDKKVFKLKSVYGAFSDLYPFWKNHISNKLTPEELTAGIGDTYLVNPPSSFKKLRFKKYQNLLWSIDCV